MPFLALYYLDSSVLSHQLRELPVFFKKHLQLLDNYLIAHKSFDFWACQSSRHIMHSLCRCFAFYFAHKTCTKQLIDLIFFVILVLGQILWLAQHPTFCSLGVAPLKFNLHHILDHNVIPFISSPVIPNIDDFLNQDLYFVHHLFTEILHSSTSMSRSALPSNPSFVFHSF